MNSTMRSEGTVVLSASVAVHGVDELFHLVGSTHYLPFSHLGHGVACSGLWETLKPRLNSQFAHPLHLLARLLRTSAQSNYSL